jgi:hypothetical protein
LLKALYGTMRAARLFWEKLSAKLQEWGYTPNPYDSCVVNKMINGKQCTVAWHVDDLKISHVETTVVDEFIEMMEQEFGKEAPLSKSRGKIHDYLGMTLDFSKPGQVTISMIDYLKMVLSDIPTSMVGEAATPAANHLFATNDNPVMIDAERKESYVHIVMQLLYVSQRARPDIRTAISFLCGRIQSPDADDYKKLTRLVKYLQSTVDLDLCLSADSMDEIHWSVDASFAVHPNMRGHTGGTMSLGKGAVYSTSTKQKLVARSSTESEIIGVHDVMPQLLWTAYFLKAQGVAVNDSVLYQDNMSSILLETNGRASASKRSRHMNIRYFFVKDRVDSKEVRIEYCPTEDMVADYFTKAVGLPAVSWLGRPVKRSAIAEKAVSRAVIVSKAEAWATMLPRLQDSKRNEHIGRGLGLRASGGWLRPGQVEGLPFVRRRPASIWIGVTIVRTIPYPRRGLIGNCSSSALHPSIHHGLP